VGTLRDHRGIVAIGASAGGVQALVCIVSKLPPDLDAAIFVSVHISQFSRSALPAILNRAGRLPAAQAADDEPIIAGRIYIAPPDRHLLVTPERIRVSRGPRERGHRPSIDAMFRSVANAYGRAAVGVVLTGSLDDGAAGAREVKRNGGMVVIQSDAVYPDMPRNVAAATAVDHRASLDEIAGVIRAAVLEPVVVPA
jgi:two-component system chemotaxis response regulator CheB